MEAMWGEWRCGSASYTRGEGASGGVAEEGVAADALAVRGALLARAVHRAQLRARNTVRVNVGVTYPAVIAILMSSAEVGAPPSGPSVRARFAWGSSIMFAWVS